MMNTESQPQAQAEITTPDRNSLLQGSWEQSGRSLNTAAIIALLGIGVLYFNAESIIVVITIGIGQLVSGGPDMSGNYFDRLSEFMKYYAAPLQAVVLVSEFSFMLMPVLWLIKRWHTSDIRGYIRLKRSSFVEILLAVIATLTLIPASNWIADELLRQLHIPEKLLEMNAEIFTAHSTGELLWLVVVICLTPAICEEIFFRGYVQRTFERTIRWKSILLVGIFFGLFHFQPLGLVSLSMLGILFGYFYYRSKSLLPSMAAHFTNNFVAILILYQPMDTQQEGIRSIAGQLPLWLIGATLPVEIGILYLYQKVTNKYNP
ncbi:MAG: CPBP family intramembrane glutamic endopeptidase [Bacteroidota bacterium]